MSDPQPAPEPGRPALGDGSQVTLRRAQENDFPGSLLDENQIAFCIQSTRLRSRPMHGVKARNAERVAEAYAQSAPVNSRINATTDSRGR